MKEYPHPALAAAEIYSVSRDPDQQITWLRLRLQTSNNEDET